MIVRKVRHSAGDAQLLAKPVPTSSSGKDFGSTIRTPDGVQETEAKYRSQTSLGMSSKR